MTEARAARGDAVFLNLGTHAAIPNVPGLDAARPLTHVEALELDHLPSHLIMIGGGYAGLELAQAYRRFGSDVTIIESGPQLMGREDVDVAQEMRRILVTKASKSVEAQLLHVRGRSGEQVSLVVRTPSGERTIDGSDILVAAGRIPNTAGIGLEATGVELDARGYIHVNERLETTASKIWAIGECAGSPQFTHISEDDFRIIRDNLVGGKRGTRDRLVPYWHVHGPSARPRGTERTRSCTPRRHCTRRQAADERGAAGASDRRETRLHEGSGR